MPKKWNEDQTLVDSVAANLMEMLPVFPKGLVRTDELVRDHKMPFSHMQILVMLERGDMSIGEISQRLGIAKPNITPMVDIMRDAGLVERVRSQADKRIVHVHLLDAGRARVAALQKDIAAQAAAWKGNLSRSEIKELNSAMVSIIRITGSMNG